MSQYTNEQQDMTYEAILAFHGHECPGVAIGYRMAKAALDKLTALRAVDEELVAIVENDACGVDALQCMTGCTFGKANLIFRDGSSAESVGKWMKEDGESEVFLGDTSPEW